MIFEHETPSMNTDEGVMLKAQGSREGAWSDMLACLRMPMHQPDQAVEAIQHPDNWPARWMVAHGLLAMFLDAGKRV